MKPEVIVVKYRPDPRAHTHGPTPKVSYQAKIVGVNGQEHWIDYPHERKRYVKKDAVYWADLLGVPVTEIDLTSKWGKSS